MDSRRQKQFPRDNRHLPATKRMNENQTASGIFRFHSSLVAGVVSFFQDSFLFFLVVRCLLLRLLRLMKNYNSKKEDLEEEDQRQDERNVIL